MNITIVDLIFDRKLCALSVIVTRLWLKNNKFYSSSSIYHSVDDATSYDYDILIHLCRCSSLFFFSQSNFR